MTDNVRAMPEQVERLAEADGVPPRQRRYVNLSEEVGKVAGRGGRTVFQIDSKPITIKTPRQLIREGKQPFVIDENPGRLGPSNPPESAVLRAYGVGGTQGDYGVRDFESLEGTDREVFDKMVREATVDLERGRRAAKAPAGETHDPSEAATPKAKGAAA